MDNTFLKKRFIRQLLLAIGINTNSNTLILAWAIIESKNKDSWRYFFCHLATAILDLVEETIVLVLDRDKGIAAADNELGPEILRAIYA
jgi:hypothetical protein